MDLMELVMEARKSPTKINVKAGTSEDSNEGDPSASVPEDPDENAEDTANERDIVTEDPSKNVPEDDAEVTDNAENDDDQDEDTDPSENVPTADDEGGGEDNQNYGISVNAGGGNEGGDDTDPSEAVPTDDEGGGEQGAPADTGAGDTDPSANVPDDGGGNAPEAGGEQPSDTGAGIQVNANAADDTATVNTDDFSANVPDPDGGNDADQGGVGDYNQQLQQGAEDPNNPQGGNNPNAGGDDQQQGDDPNTEGGEEGAEGEGEDDNGDIDNMDSANSFSDASDNGEDTKSITDTDKKNNIIILRNGYVKLYTEVSSFINKLQNTRKDSILSVATYSQVKENMEKLRAFLMDYICIYYDTNEYEINLFNFEYILRHIRVNVRMIEKMKEGKAKLGLVNSLKETKKRK